VTETPPRDPPGNPPSDPLGFVLFNEIGIIEQLARNRFESVMPHGMLLAHFTMLNHLVRMGDGRNPADIAHALQLARGAVTNTVQRLGARGYLRVEPDPEDGRAKRVYLTDAGRRARGDAIAAVAPLIAKLESELGHGMFDDLLPSLQRLRAWLDDEREADKGEQPSR
jgi:DNA-binding MarR family transcriptional regulator